MMKRTILILFKLLLISEIVNANEIELGIATTYSNNGIGSEQQLYPFISYSNDTFYFEGTSLGFNLSEGEAGDYFTYDASTFISYEDNGYEPDEKLGSSRVNSPNNSVDLGIQLDVISAFGGIYFSVQRDVSNTYNGNQATLSLGFTFDGERWSFTPFVSFEYLSKEYVDYYYSIISEAQASSGNLNYTGKSTVNKSIGCAIDVEFTESWNSSLVLKYGENGSSIRNSPFADSDKFVETVFVIAYTY